MDIKGIQVIFFAVSLVFVVLMVNVRHKGRVGSPFFVLWTILWASIGTLSLFPSVIAPLIPILGLTDLKSLVYSIAILALFLISTVLFVQLGALRTGLTNIVSQNALQAVQSSPMDGLAVKGSERVAVVIPARNEEHTIAGVIKGIRELELGDAVIEVVDDGSEDRTAQAASAAGAQVLVHATNLGIGAALKTGYLAAAKSGAKWLVQIDADGQHSPGDIIQLLGKLKESDAEVVIGSRFLSGGTVQLSYARRAGIKFYTWLVNAMTGLHLTDVTCGLRAFKMTSLQVLMFKSQGAWAIETTLRAGRAGLRVAEVPIQDRQRQNGISQFNSIALFLTYHYRALKQILNVYL